MDVFKVGAVVALAVVGVLAVVLGLVTESAPPGVSQMDGGLKNFFSIPVLFFTLHLRG